MDEVQIYRIESVVQAIEPSPRGDRVISKDALERWTTTYLKAWSAASLGIAPGSRIAVRCTLEVVRDEAMVKPIVSNPRRDADGNILVTIPAGIRAKMDPEKLYFLEPSGRVVDAKGNPVEPDPEPAVSEPEGSWRDRPPLL